MARDPWFDAAKADVKRQIKNAQTCMAEAHDKADGHEKFYWVGRQDGLRYAMWLLCAGESGNSQSEPRA